MPERDQPYSAKARKFSSDLVFGREATVHAKELDRYGRVRPSAR